MLQTVSMHVSVDRLLVIVIHKCVVSPQIYLTKPHDDEDRWGASKVSLMYLLNTFSFKVAHLWVGLGTETRYQYGTGTYGTGMY